MSFASYMRSEGLLPDYDGTEDDMETDARANAARLFWYWSDYIGMTEQSAADEVWSGYIELMQSVGLMTSYTREMWEMDCGVTR